MVLFPVKKEQEKVPETDVAEQIRKPAGLPGRRPFDKRRVYCKKETVSGSAILEISFFVHKYTFYIKSVLFAPCSVE